MGNAGCQRTIARAGRAPRAGCHAVRRASAAHASGPSRRLRGVPRPTGSLSEPYERLARPARVLDTIGFGTQGQADRATARVRAIHRRVRGELAHSAGRFPAGTPYVADDPELLLWILACIADSAQTVHECYMRALSARERDSYWQDCRTTGRRFG
ncbi:MAG TPA: oxygenase MpaB family protein [Solirubrobacteraceae bacterium]